MLTDLIVILSLFSHIEVSLYAPSYANAIISVVFSTMNYAFNDPVSNLREHCLCSAALGHGKGRNEF
jgi:hypothetical protein